ncbi:MAG TPA: cellulase family glycosylhydrolase [Terriglobales bacterium]|nr:cellulase family glycosylhydrolase [Terriglobales bacterium]
MYTRTVVPLFLVFVISSFLQSQDPPTSPAWKRAQHLRHGINASEWFAQSSDYSVQRLSSYTTHDDIALMHKVGFDHVRLSIDPAIFECRGSWQDCDRIKALDAVVAKSLAEDLAIIIDLHPTTEFKRRLATENFTAEKFRLLWGSIAKHFASSDPEMVVFEILNEPEDRDPYQWSGIEIRVLDEIRRRAPRHSVIVSGMRYSDIGDLIQLPQLNDDNLIYNFHYYEPHLFTHQGASWGVPFWINLRDVPYPLSPDSVTKPIAQQEDLTAKWELLEAGYGHWDRDRIAGEMRFAAEWAKAHHVPLTCNEFGVYRTYSNAEARMRWIENVRSALEANNIGWTMWDYRGGFGVVTKQNGSTTPDDGILHALGLK